MNSLISRVVGPLVAVLFVPPALAMAPRAPVGPDDVRHAITDAIATAQYSLTLEKELKQVVGAGQGFRFSDPAPNTIVISNKRFSRYFYGHRYFNGNGYTGCDDIKTGFRHARSLEATLERKMGTLSGLVSRPGFWDRKEDLHKAQDLADSLSSVETEIDKAFPQNWISADAWRMDDTAYTFFWDTPFSAQQTVPPNAQISSQAFWLTRMVSLTDSWTVDRGRLPENYWFSNQMGPLDRSHPSDRFVWPDIWFSVGASFGALCLVDPKIELTGIWRVVYRLPGSDELLNSDTQLLLQGTVLPDSDSNLVY